MRRRITALVATSLLVTGCSTASTGGGAGLQNGGGWTSLFNGRDLTGWRVPEGDNGHWRVVNGVIDYDALSEASGEKHLWSEREYRDFTLRLDWRIKEYSPGAYPMPNVLPDGTDELGPDGKVKLTPRPNADSGIYLRGTSKAQVNIWAWPVGSGEVYGYRTDTSMPASVRAGATPRVQADRPVGEWNEMEITMRGERLTVVLNGQTVIQNAHLPGVPETGRLAFQHHGGRRADGTLDPASSLVQFRNIQIREF